MGRQQRLRELVAIHDGRPVTVARLPGWTRGLLWPASVAFVGTSRVIPRFRTYAPGLDVDRSVCGVHAVDIRSGQVLGSILWPAGNQIFAIEALPGRPRRVSPHIAGADSAATPLAPFSTHTRPPTAQERHE